MTDKELIKLSRENLRKSKKGSLCELYDEAFIEGYKSGRPKWHKTADGDLPNENKRYLCKIKEFVGSDISYECFDYDTEYSSWKNACGDVISWCEIPKYMED